MRTPNGVLFFFVLKYIIMKTIAKLLLKYFPALCVEIFALMSKQQDDQRIEQWEEMEHHRHDLYHDLFCDYE